MHGGPSGLAQHLDRRQCRRDRLGVQRKRVEAPRILVQRGLDAGGGVGEVAVAAPGDAQALAQPWRHIEHARAVRTAQPLLTGARVGVAAERVHVHRHRAHALGAVEQDRHLELGQLRRREGPAHPAHVRAGHEPRARVHRFGQLAQRRFTYLHAVQLARGRERPQQARVLLVARQDLIATGELQPTDRLRDALGRARGQREVGRVTAEERGVGRPQRVCELGAAFEVGNRAALEQLALELGGGRPRGGRGQRPVGAGVQVGRALQHGKLGSQRGQAHEARE